MDVQELQITALQDGLLMETAPVAEGTPQYSVNAFRR